MIGMCNTRQLEMSVNHMKAVIERLKIVGMR